MTKLVLNTLASIANQTIATSTINNNSSAIIAAFENTLSRDGTSPNEMGANFDMNGYRILNLPTPVADQEPLRKIDAQPFVDAAEAAQAAAEAALDAFTDIYLGPKGANPTTDNDGDPLVAGALYYNTNDGVMYVYGSGVWEALDADAADEAAAAAQSAQDAADSAADALAKLNAFNDVYLGNYAVAPTLDNDGSPLETGDLYFDTVQNNLYIYNGVQWVVAAGLTAVSQDLTPTLGGNLDLDGNDITGTGDINITGDIDASNVTVDDEAYASGWNGSTEVPTKNAVYDKIESVVSDANTALNNHLNDTTDAHDASAISFVATGTISATNVQSAIEEVNNEKQPLDADLTAIAALAPANDAIIQRKSGVWTSRTIAQLITDLTSGLDALFLTPAEGNAAYQPLDADLTSIAALSTQSYGRSLLTSSSEANFKALVNLEIGVDVQAYDADTLKADVSDNLDVGYTVSSYSGGTQSSGTYTPNPANGNKQHITNGGAFTLGVPSSNCNIELEVTNNGSAGTITTSSYTKKSGDTLTTTNGHKFIIYITKTQNYSLCNVVALQ